MRGRLLRVDDDSTVLLVYPATLEEYGRALETLGAAGRGAGDGSPEVSRGEGGPVQVGYVVTTAAQRDRWGLPDVAASGRACVVDERQALDMLREGAVRPTGADEALAESTGEAARAPRDAAARSGLDAVRGLAAPGARVDQVLKVLEGAELPEPVCGRLRRALRQALASEAAAVEETLERAETVLSLPWRTRAPEQFDAAHLKRALDRTHGGLEQVKTRLIEVLAACPRAAHRGRPAPRRRSRDAGGRAGRTPRSAAGRGPGSLPCRRPGYGKDIAGRCRRAGARAVPRARAAGQGESREPDPRDREPRHGAHRRRPARGRGQQPRLHPRGARPGGVGSRRRAARRPGPRTADGVPGRVPPGPVRSVPGRVDRDGDRIRGDTGSVAQADQGDRVAGVHHRGKGGHRAAAPADAPVRRALIHGATSLLPEPAAATESDIACNGPAVLLDREVLSVQELAALSAAPRHDTVETWQTAACTGGIRFEPEAVRRVIEDHTSEPGVSDLQAKLAAVCRQMVLGGQVKSGHLWTPQIRPFPASRDGSLRFTSWRPVLARLSESPAFAASAATPDRARRAQAPTARRASGVKTSTAGTPSSRPGRKAHNCSLSGGTAGVSPARAEAHAEDARSALTRRSARSYLRPCIAASHRIRPSAAAANPLQFRAVYSSSPRLCPPNQNGFRPVHTCLKRAGCLDPGAPAARSALEHVCVMQEPVE